MTAYAFFVFAIGLAFQIPNAFIVQTFYSAHNTKTPMIIASCCAVINIIGNLILIKPLGIGGIALSTSIAMVVQLIVLLFVLNKRNPGLIDARFSLKVIEIVPAGAAAVLASYPCHLFAVKVIQISSSATLSHLLQMIIPVIVVALVYLLILKILRFEEIKYLNHLIKRRS
jgi:putative peptidoglycan lipid II flippase